jgi:hypothetical protein
MIMGAAWRLPAISLLGGGMLAMLAVYCAMYLGSHLMTVYAPLALPLGCGISTIVVQLFLHGESLESVKPFILWMFTLMLVQALALRQNFLHHFALVAFVVALAALPHLRANFGQGGVVRMDLERTTSIPLLANGNGLAAWFGFCCVYWTIVGLEAKRTAVRVASWLAATGCLYVVGLTVGRGALFAVAIAIIVALRRLLKRGFVPLLVLIILSWITYETGLFKPMADFYAARGVENTGRLTVWPLVLERFLSAPLGGVGISNIGTSTPRGKVITPHNSFLYIALASGVVPLIFFLGYWIRTAREAFGPNVAQVPDAPFRLSLFIYVLLIDLQLNAYFMTPCTLVTLCVVSSTPYQLRRTKRLKLRAKVSL